MSCAHLMTVPSHSYFVNGKIITDPRTLKVPCGWCINCRRDKQQFFIDRAQYEYCKKLTGAFVTFTYDPVWLLSQCSVKDGFGKPMYDLNDDGEPSLRVTLNYSDFTRFIDNIRKKINYFYDSHPEIKESLLMQRNFSYLYCGEYGEISGEHGNNGRPHFHCLFFGLDFAYCKDIIFGSWKYGFIDVLPILDGGIRYVTKYMDKFVSGELAFWQYDAKGKARPRLRASVGFGQDLLWDNIDDIYANFLTYKTTHNRRRPISAYWKYLVTGSSSARDPLRSDTFVENPDYTAFKRFSIAQNMIQMNLHRRMNVYDKKNQDEFRLRQAKIQEEQLKIELRNNGCPVCEDLNLVTNHKFGWIGYNHEKVKRLPSSYQRLLADAYRSSLELRWLNDKFKEVLS